MLTTTGAIMQMPMYFMAGDMRYRIAGMAMTTEMWAGMVIVFAGLGLTAYSLFPRSRPAEAEMGNVAITPLDDAKISAAHVALLFVTAFAVVIDGMKPAAFGFVVVGAEAEYGLRGPQHPAADALPVGLYPLSGILGTMVGSFVWGWLGDRIGRRASILLAAMLFIGSSMCGAMPEYWMNLVCCFIMGLGAGGMIPIVFSLLAETVPRRHRGWMMLLIGSNIATAYVAVSWLASTLASPDNFGWRMLWLVGLPTGVLLIVLNHWIPESPRYLLQQGRDEEARAVMRRYGAVLVARPPDSAPERERDYGSGDLFRGPFLGLTGGIVLLGLSIGGVQYGFQQWMPSNLERLGLSSTDASGIMRNAAVIGLPLTLPVALLYHRWSSKKTALLVSGIIGVALIGFVMLGGQAAANRPLLYVLLIVPVWGVGIMNAVLAAYTAEVYPTAVRARGSGVSAGATKAGGVLILALAVVAFAAPSIRMTAAVGAIPMMLAVVVLAMFGPETRHKRLEQITTEELPGRASTPSAAPVEN
ncbi:MFS transporter [Actinomadura latina]|uniref:MFS transporter n=1 Tax=Actinomadura latina TaxID=163603 RepID=A0A846YTN8_9ACTN|nr:MFS transporter [Actinomadura latina]NKZ03729.1 MFS transporter [Actinomadura latina]